jgi:septal ring factor EnvC (AmiA/AmiB activator)
LPSCLRAVGVALLCLLPSLLPAQEEEQQRLEAVRERIEQVSAALAADREQEDALTAELRRLESRIGDTLVALAALRDRIATAEEAVASARRELDAERERLTEHRRRLAGQVRAAHRIGREEYLRLLLNQEDPDRIDRVLVYYRYLAEARAERLRQSMAALDRLQRLRQRLDGELARLRGLEEERAARLGGLRADRAERAEVLATLQQRMASRDAELAQLRADEERLQALVAELRERLADIPELGGAQAFGASRGSLPWPLAGPLVARFGETRSGSLRWSGLLIGAEAGDPVRAVSHGRVVFSDWLRGLGLLLIIDHGDGYLTLYGHNQALYKEAGDWVDAGEIIATVGTSGGRSRGRDALYFEVRADGDPVDPLGWLQPAPARG